MKQSVFTKKMNFLAFTFFLMASTFSQLSFAAVAKLPQINFGTRSQTEGSICTDCAVRAPQSSLMGQLAQLTGPERIFNAAYFDDNGERSTLVELRNRRARGESLTVEERAILQAADRVGAVVWPNCIHPQTGQPVNGNAFLIQINGRDAIVTAAHFIKNDSGQFPSGCDLNDFRNANFMPNVSYYGHTGPGGISNEDLYAKVGATAESRLGDFSNGGIEFNNDWLVLFLDEQISNSPAPNQRSPRGFIQFANSRNNGQQFESYIIGEDGRQELGVTTYQKCQTVTENNTSYNSCDTDRGSSGSLVGVLENSEIKFESINIRASRLPEISGEHALPENFRDWNQGLSSDHIYDEIQRVLNPQGTDV